MSRPRCSLMDAHNALSHLVFAAKQALEPFSVDVKVEWRNGTYLTLYVECMAGRADAIMARLKHGFLQGDYDYRFRCIGWPGEDVVSKLHPLHDRITISAMPDMSHDMALFKGASA